MERQIARITDKVLIPRAFDDATKHFAEGCLVQHSPELPDGAQAWLDALAASGNGPRYRRRHKVLGKGNFVLLLSEGEFKRDGSRTPIGLYDLYRLEDGLIAEHWEVVDPSFPAPIYATLIEVEGQEGLHLTWSRPTRD